MLILGGQAFAVRVIDEVAERSFHQTVFQWLSHRRAMEDLRSCHVTLDVSTVDKKLSFGLLALPNNVVFVTAPVAGLLGLVYSSVS